jgi:hypothetical protein
MEAQSNKLRANNTTWCSFTVTSSNAVMSDALAAHRSAVEGELKRVIDLRITIPQSIPKAESDALFAKLAVNYGIAGPMLVQHVVNNREIIEAELKVIQLQVDRDAQFERNDRFYSAVCAPAVAVGRIGNALGLWNLDIERIYKWAIAQVQTVRDTNANSVGTAATLAVETLARFISDNVGNALIIDGHRTHGAPSAPVQVPRGPLRLRYEPDTKLMFVLASDLRTFFVDRRVDFKASLEEFKNSGALICPKPGELVTTKRIAAGAVGGMAAPAARCYAFNAELLGLAPAIASNGAD